MFPIELVVSTYSGNVTDPLQLYKSKHRKSDLCLALLRSNQGPEEYTAILAGMETVIWIPNHIPVPFRFVMQSLAKSLQLWTSSHLWVLQISSLHLRMAGWAWPNSVQRQMPMRGILVRTVIVNISTLLSDYSCCSQLVGVSWILLGRSKQVWVSGCCQ